MQRAQGNTLSLGMERFSSIADQLNLVSPLATIGRGFAIARDNDGIILRHSKQASPDDKISVQLSDGLLDCTVV